jgi:hypothetical protein
MEALHSSRGSSRSFNQAVPRSNEFLSCAKTSWKIRQQERSRQQQHQRGPADGNPPLPLPSPKNPNLLLASSAGPPPASLVILEDGLTLLRAMEYGTKKLQGLVRRRGHTNDPTEEIGAIVRQLEQDFKELTSYCEQILKIRRRKQEKRHWDLVVQWFQQVANHHSGQLQDCLKLRGEILADQAQKRRKLVNRNSGKNKNKSNASFKGTEIGAALGAASASGAATPLFDSPLFTAKPPNRNHNNNNNNDNTPTRRDDNGIQVTKQQSASRRVQPATSGNSSNYYQQKTPAINGARTGAVGTAYGSAYGGAYGGASSAGYGGGGYGGGGMRQRRGGNNPPSSSVPFEEQEEEQKIHSQIQIREQKRQTQQRLDEARQAESTLSQVATLYSKMSTLITQQGETLEKIEDDVECALVDVSAGQEELTKLYSIKKGNRPLIIKIYSILIFLIIFMRGYKDR